MKMSIAERIKTIRKEKGLTQKQLAEKTGLLEPTIRKYESGKIQPKSENLNKIASALGVHPFQIGQMLTHNTESDVIVKFFDLDPDDQKKVSEYIDFLKWKDGER